MWQLLSPEGALFSGQGFLLSPRMLPFPLVAIPPVNEHILRDWAMCHLLVVTSGFMSFTHSIPTAPASNILACSYFKTFAWTTTSGTFFYDIYMTSSLTLFQGFS